MTFIYILRLELDLYINAVCVSSFLLIIYYSKTNCDIYQMFTAAFHVEGQIVC